MVIGSVIDDRYELRSIVGCGAMSTVFLAWHLRLQCQVAVKILHPTLVSVDDHTERFEREARSLARLDHPNCVRVIDYGITEDDVHFLVTEFIRGVELGELMKGPTEPWLAARRVRKILAGLEHAHACGVIHRDLKPENILVTRGPDDVEALKLIDFGIAKIVGAMPALGVVFGTPQYMSPEQAAGAAVDYRSDVYAAGVLLYAMLAGRLPFDDVNPRVVLDRQIREPVAPLPVTLPAALRRIAMRMLQKDPAQRFHAAAAAIDALVGAELRRSVCGVGSVRLRRTAGRRGRKTNDESQIDDPVRSRPRVVLGRRVHQEPVRGARRGASRDGRGAR